MLAVLKNQICSCELLAGAREMRHLIIYLPKSDAAQSNPFDGSILSLSRWGGLLSELWLQNGVRVCKPQASGKWWGSWDMFLPKKLTHKQVDHPSLKQSSSWALPSGSHISNTSVYVSYRKGCPYIDMDANKYTIHTYIYICIVYCICIIININAPKKGLWTAPFSSHSRSHKKEGGCDETAIWARTLVAMGPGGLERPTEKGRPRWVGGLTMVLLRSEEVGHEA